MALMPIALRDAELAFDPQWLPLGEADALFEVLRHAVPWQTHRVKLFGREIESPRRSCWIGDADAVYTYSGTRHLPLPWTPPLHALRQQLELACGARFNSVLANLYRDGADAMGWHSDDERELGEAPVIASLSLGATRRFVLRHRRLPQQRYALELPGGSLLLVQGTTQRCWKHALPPTRRVVGARINLTFRRILAPSEGRA